MSERSERGSHLRSYVFRTTRTIQDGGGKRRVGTTRFLLVLTGGPVVTLSTAGRARISLKHGLEAPNPDDLVSHNRLWYSSPFSCSSLRRSIIALETKLSNSNPCKI